MINLMYYDQIIKLQYILIYLLKMNRYVRLFTVIHPKLKNFPISLFHFLQPIIKFFNPIFAKVWFKPLFFFVIRTLFPLHLFYHCFSRSSVFMTRIFAGFCTHTSSLISKIAMPRLRTTS